MKILTIAMLAAASLAPVTGHAQVVALGLTHHQLEDADLIDAHGRDIGEVERVLTGPDGKVVGLIVEIDQRDPTPDKHVQIALTGLKAVPEHGDPGEFRIQTSQTVQALLALPAARQP